MAPMNGSSEVEGVSLNLRLDLEIFAQSIGLAFLSV